MHELLMNTYQLLKFYKRIRDPRVKAVGLLGLHLLHRRYVHFFLDPVLSCNFRCRMCYFSIPEFREPLRGLHFTQDDVQAIAKSIFPSTLKLQVGCGAEPTVYGHLPLIIKLAKKYSVPYVSLTTNGNLLQEELLTKLLETGLDEVTISAHGFSRECYESMMPGASFDKFLVLIKTLKKLQQLYPNFKVRLNFTVNEDNMSNLPLMPRLFEGLKLFVFQIRPIQKLGETSYANFSKTKMIAHYDDYILPVVEHFRSLGTLVIYPSADNLRSVDGVTDTDTTNNMIDSIPQFYLAPHKGWKERKINPYKESFRDYCKRTHRVRFLLRSIFLRTGKNDKIATKELNYVVTD